MKLKATIEVEFEGRTGAHESTLRHALSRGLVGLKGAIERGMSGNTNIKRGSTNCRVVEQEIVRDDE